jgi:hypothetical protein
LVGVAVAAHHLVLYSAQTWLSFAIASKYFGDVHYAWCTPYFNGTPAYTLAPGGNPPSSAPGQIAKALRNDVDGGDLHSAKIDENRAGLRRGAQAKLQSGVITEAVFRDIGTIIDAAPLDYFRPLVYVIPISGVRELLEDVPVEDKANLLSEEYRISELPRAAFDIIEVS